MAHVVLVLAGEHVAGLAERVDAVAVLDALHPVADIPDLPAAVLCI